MVEEQRGILVATVMVEPMKPEIGVGGIVAVMVTASAEADMVVVVAAAVADTVVVIVAAVVAGG